MELVEAGLGGARCGKAVEARHGPARRGLARPGEAVMVWPGEA